MHTAKLKFAKNIGLYVIYMLHQQGCCNQKGVDFIKVGPMTYSIRRTQILEKMQESGRKAQIHDAKLVQKRGRRRG
jgi:hypothetical protein